jgi:hypothetical protein
MISVCANAQEERDTTLKRCPIFITDTVSNNNFFIEAKPATIKVYRSKGELTIRVEQKDQFFTLFFNEKKLSTGTYKISVVARKNMQVAAKYSFTSGDQVSYVNVSSGTVDVSYDEAKQHWRLKVNGMIANRVERSVSYYRTRADLYIK